MEILKFTIKGYGATFTIPYIEEDNLRFTYEHIPKTCILSVLGSIAGIKEYNNIKNIVPNFYKELDDLEISIIPKNILFTKQIDVLTEGTGSKNYKNGKGMTYVNKITTLINPSWDIYIKKSDNKYYDKIKDYLLNSRYYKKPYLGTNIHFANINNIEVIAGKETDLETEQKIDSLFIRTNDYIIDDDDGEYFEQYMPIGYEEFEIADLGSNDFFKFNQYKEEKIAFAIDCEIENKNIVQLIKIKDKCLYFF